MTVTNSGYELLKKEACLKHSYICVRFFFIKKQNVQTIEDSRAMVQ